MKRFRDYILGVLTVVVIMAFALPTIAASSNKNMTVTYRDIKISVNGSYITPKDAQGRTVEPFIYEGTTYLPVRATAEAVGYNVTWDNNTSTVYLTNGSGTGTGGNTGGNTGGSGTAPAVKLSTPCRLTRHLILRLSIILPPEMTRLPWAAQLTRMPSLSTTP